MRHRGTLGYDVAGHCLYNLPLRQVDLLGGELLLPPDMGIHDHFFLTLDHTFPEAECFLLDSLLCSSFTWRYLQESAVVRRRFLPYAIDGACDYHTLSLPPTFAGYLASSTARSVIISSGRYGFCTNCGEEIELVRVDSRADIDLWLTARYVIDRSKSRFSAEHIEKNGDAKAVRRMADLADRGLLRNYVLKSADQFFGCISGCQFRDTYNVWYIIHNQDFAKYSPGTSTFFLAIEDLLRYRPVKMVNLGFGNPRHMFSTQMIAQHATVILFAKRRAIDSTGQATPRCDPPWSS